MEKEISVIENGIVSTSNSKVVVDHASDLSSSKKPILFLSFLYVRTDLLLELGILDDLVPIFQHENVEGVGEFVKLKLPYL